MPCEIGKTSSILTIGLRGCSIGRGLLLRLCIGSIIRFMKVKDQLSNIINRTSNRDGS